MGNDDERTLADLKAARRTLIDPNVATHRGRIVKTTGDGMLMEFASAVDAVRCAVEIQRGMAEKNGQVPKEVRMEFRVGIHVGDILSDDNDIFGDGVNIAARLEGIAEPGGVCLSGAAYEQVRDKLNEVFVDLGEMTLKNIARPVRAFAVHGGARMPAAAPGRSTPEEFGPPRLSIVVLPFANLGEAGHDSFVDGMTEILTTDLSHLSNSFVVAHHTAFSYKGKSVDIKQIGRELNVRYALEGSVQCVGSKMRVNVQLIDVASGAHLWAERFDKQMTNLLDTQDEIVSRVANQLPRVLVSVEAQRSEHKTHPDSMDHYLLGTACSNRGMSPEHLAQARFHFERAVALDLQNIDALVGVARIDAIVGSQITNDHRSALFAAAEANLLKALSLSPDNVWAHLWLGFVQGMTNRAAVSVAQLERTLALNSNIATAHAWMGMAKLSLGRGEETEAHIDEAFRISPREHTAFSWLFMAGIAKLHLGADEDAVAKFRRSIEINRNFPPVHLYLAAALAHLGRLDEARAAVKIGLAMDPKFSIAYFRAAAESDNATFLAQRERVIEGLRLAAVPEA